MKTEAWLLIGMTGALLGAITLYSLRGRSGSAVSGIMGRLFLAFSALLISGALGGPGPSLWNGLLTAALGAPGYLAVWAIQAL